MSWVYFMTKIKSLFLLFFCSVAATGGLVGCGGGGGGGSGQSSVVRTDSRPNVIFVYTDDHGYADIGAQGVVNDIKTPNIDQLAATGVRMTDGYVTAPQCTPSRSALMSGRYQQKFGLDDNNYTPYPLSQPMLAEKLGASGYKTGMVGKWHLEIDQNSADWYKNTYAGSGAFNLANIPESEKVKYYPENRGFQESFFGYRNTYRANFDTSGNTFSYRNVSDSRFRVDVVSDAAVSFINRHKQDPFFLYVAYYAPHVPLEATEEYLSRFPGSMPERRRYALAMLAAVDDGVGRIMQTLQNYGIDDDTIIFFMSDNGAPLALTKPDTQPVSATDGAWDGSVNDPWVGEKGMLTEGAIRVPYVVNWKGHLPQGLVYRNPVITLDATKTAAVLAGVDSSDLDGINLIPYLQNTALVPERALYWRFWQQAAIRKGKWKYLRKADEGDYLFDLSSDVDEKQNLITAHPNVAAALQQDLTTWSTTLKRPGIPSGSMSQQEQTWYNYYFQ